jgi:arrestin-related trafficking adapter 3/6
LVSPSTLPIISRPVHYHARGPQVSRNETPRHLELLALNPPDKDKEPRLLPILSDSPMAVASSPLAQYARPGSARPLPALASTEALLQSSEISSHLLNPSGPWRLSLNLPVPDCSSGIHFTNKLRGARIVVVHHLRVGLRVSSGLSEYDGNGNKSKMFDIIVEIPVNILSVRITLLFVGIAILSPLRK